MQARGGFEGRAGLRAGFQEARDEFRGWKSVRRHAARPDLRAAALPANHGDQSQVGDFEICGESGAQMRDGAVDFPEAGSLDLDGVDLHPRARNPGDVAFQIRAGQRADGDRSLPHHGRFEFVQSRRRHDEPPQHPRFRRRPVAQIVFHGLGHAERAGWK